MQIQLNAVLALTVAIMSAVPAIADEPKADKSQTNAAAMPVVFDPPPPETLATITHRALRSELLSMAAEDQLARSRGR